MSSVHVPPPPQPAVVVAIGGNALAAVRAGREKLSADTDSPYVQTARVVASLAVDHRVIVVHGNGPQVGAEWLGGLFQLDARPPDLNTAIAKTQASIGLKLASAVDSVIDDTAGLSGSVVVVLTRVLVEPKIGRQTVAMKPIGGFLSRRERNHAEHMGLPLSHEADHGWRVTVPSPRPTRIVELSAIKDLSEAGHIVIAGGGGGVPVAGQPSDPGDGSHGVIDKDWTAAVLACEIGAQLLLILTDAPGVAINFGTDAEYWPRAIGLECLQELLTDSDEFAEGSIRPKLEAVAHYLSTRPSNHTKREAIITSLLHAQDSLIGGAGTSISCC